MYDFTDAKLWELVRFDNQFITPTMKENILYILDYDFSDLLFVVPLRQRISASLPLPLPLPLMMMIMMNSTFLLHQRQRHFATSILTNRLRTLCRKAYSAPYAFKSVVLCNNSKALSRTISTNSSSRNQNLYGILNVSKTATQKEIKLAYFREVRMKN